MSQSGSPCRSPPNTDIPCIGENTKSSKDASLNVTDTVSKDQTGPDSDDRERVVKEVGQTSATFIGPCFPPAPARAKSDLENELSEFYKDLEATDEPSGAHDNSGTQEDKVRPPSLQKTQGVAQKTTSAEQEFAETDGYWKSGGQKWPHWYQNEPYHVKKLRPDRTPVRPMSSQPQVHYQQPLETPPSLGPLRPSFHNPPPPYAFPHPQTQAPPHADPAWSGPHMSSHYLQDGHAQRFDEHHSHRGDRYENDQQNLNRSGHGYEYRNYLDDGNADWLRNNERERPQFDKDHDWRQERVSGNELERQQQQRHCRPPENTDPLCSSLVLILMRGLPGSGKTTLARELVSTGPSGLILSTDDYFGRDKDYHYEPSLLGAAHEWNQRRARDAMDDQRSPIIIDNTNVEAWEMKPYVKMALEKGYRVDFREPVTRWRFDPVELGKRNTHGVHREKIAQMRQRFAFPISIDIVLSSVEPPHVTRRRRPNQRR